MYSGCAIVNYGPMYDSGGFRIVAHLDKELVNYYRALIPKEYGVQPPKYPPHITVVRVKRENPTDLSQWYRHEGEVVKFLYDGHIKFDETYFWLECYCSKLNDIRQEVGLPRERLGFKCFHITLGNIKKKNDTLS